MLAQHSNNYLRQKQKLQLQDPSSNREILIFDEPNALDDDNEKKILKI